jgi:CRISPR/Cas system-associated exonuclease Cas4 (RecB family)
MPAADWIEIDEADFEASAFPLDGVKVFAVPDLAFREADGGARVVDWKTGAQREGHDGQVLGYALYLAHRYGIDPLRVRASLVYLNAGAEVEVAVTPEALERFMAHFRGSVATMRGLLVDPGANAPRPEADFPLTEDLRTCGTCAFRRICGRLGQG